MSDERSEFDQPVRLQRFLSRAGVASRREGERLIEAGRVRVDGEVVTELGARVRPGVQRVSLDGEPVELSAMRWLALHKPAGVLTTRKDRRGRRTIYSLLPRRHKDLFYVGRLDRFTEGLLLLTNEGELAHRLTHPSYEIARRYLVEVDGLVERDQIRRLEQGVHLEDGVARAGDVELLATPSNGAGPSARSLLRLTLREGRKREVRRMLEALELRIGRLVRESFGPIALGSLASGEWRHLTAAEVHDLRAAVGLRKPNGDT